MSTALEAPRCAWSPLVLVLAAGVLSACADDNADSDGSDSDGSSDGSESDGADSDGSSDGAETNPCPLVAPPPGPARVASGEAEYTLPAPSGPYRVGTHILHVVDAARPEPVTADATDHRELVVQLYYPTDAAAGAPDPLFDDAEAAVVWGDLGIATGSIVTHSVADVPLSADKDGWPVLVYSHGLGSNRNDNRALVESLASHGIVVAAVSHSYYDIGSTLRDGRITAREALPEKPPPGFASASAEVWRSDVESVLAELSALGDTATCSFLSGRLDLSRIALVGYSFGGSTAYQVCSIDTRCRAGVDLDGTFFGPIATPLEVPFLFMSARRSELTWDLVAGRSRAVTYTAWVDGASHGNFGGLSAGLAALGVEAASVGLGPIDPQRAETILRTFVETFIREQLLDEPAGDRFADGTPADYPEVLVERAEGGVARAPGIVGAARAAIGAKAVADATVRAGAAAASTSATGSWVNTGVGAGSVVRVDVSHPDYLDWSTTLQVGTRSTAVEAFMIQPPIVTLVLSGVDVAPDPTRGHVLVRGVRSGPGLTATIEGAASYYLAPSNMIDTALSATGEAELALVPNLAPGMHALRFAHAALRCSAPQSPLTADGAATIEVRAGALSFVTVVCEEQ